MGIQYCTREDVTSALGFNESARLSSQVDRACQSAARSIEGLLNRTFYPKIDVRTFQRVNSRRLWLENNEVVSVTSIVSDGETITDYHLSPVDGPPYTSIDFPDGPIVAGEDTLVLSATFGFADDQDAAGALAAAITTTTATSLDATDGSQIGVGDVLTIGTERLQVTERTWLTTAQTTSVSASKADTSLTVASGAAFHAGEKILIDSERMIITDIAGNVLTVRRAEDGSVLAVHTTATIYASRTFTVVRGVLGSTAATHLVSAAITRLAIPGTVRTLAIALAINTLLQESGGYTRELGTGEAARIQTGAGVPALKAEAIDAFGRRARMRTV